MQQQPPVNMALVTRLLLCVCLLRGGNAFSRGAPASRCESMMPDHGTRSSYRPDSHDYFSIEVSGDGTYTAGQRLEVTLESNTRRYFKGFLLQARKTNGDVNTVGTFTAQERGTSTECAKGALTHSSSSRKPSVKAAWTAPAQSMGDVMFVATVVSTYRTIYLNVTSDVIRDLALVEAENTGKVSPASMNGTALIDLTRCSEEFLVALPPQRPHVAMMCSDDAQCPCSWRCCARCDVSTNACEGFAICREPRNDTAPASRQ